MAAGTDSTPPHDPQAEDVEGDDYDPRYDSDKDGKHNKEENDLRKHVKDWSEGNLPPPVPGEDPEYDDIADTLPKGA